MDAIKKRLVSRRFWLTVGGFITLMANYQFEEAVALLIAYIGADTAEKFNK